MEWTNESILKLLAAYKTRPVLWDSSNGNFRVKGKKDEAWDELAAIFDVENAEIKKKINSLLASFRRERKNVVKRSSANGDERLYNSKWFAFKSMLFLNQVNRAERSSDDISEMTIKYEDHNGSSSPDTQLYVTQEIIYPQSRENERKRKECNKEKNTSSDKRLKHVLEEDPIAVSSHTEIQDLSHDEKIRDECGVYAEHLANKLRRYDQRTRAIVEHHFNNILFKADMGNYKKATPQRSSFVAAPSEQSPRGESAPASPASTFDDYIE